MNVIHNKPLTLAQAAISPPTSPSPNLTKQARKPTKKPNKYNKLHLLGRTQTTHTHSHSQTHSLTLTNNNNK